MADWVWVESPGTGLTEEPRVRKSVFGDGYEQRAPDGINTLSQRWNYQANNVSDERADEMIAFLRAANGVTAFNYVPLWETVARRVVCPRWTRTLGSEIGTSNITAEFVQVFEP